MLFPALLLQLFAIVVRRESSILSALTEKFSSDLDFALSNQQANEQSGIFQVQMFNLAENNQSEYL